MPELAVHVNGPAPLELKLTLSPKHIVDDDGVMVIVDGGVTDTVAIAEAVQVPAPDRTVYVVVTAGVTVTVAALAGLGPELAVQTKGAKPLEDSTTLCPVQMFETDGVIVIDGVVETDTVAIAEAVQVPTPDTTVYEVVTPGDTVTLAALEGLVPVLAVHTNGPGPEDDKAKLCPKQIDDEAGETVIGAAGFTVTVPEPAIVVGVLAGLRPLTLTE